MTAAPSVSEDYVSVFTPTPKHKPHFDDEKTVYVIVGVSPAVSGLSLITNTTGPAARLAELRRKVEALEDHPEFEEDLDGTTSTLAFIRSVEYDAEAWQDE